MADNEFILLPITAEDVEETGIEPFLPFQTYVHNGRIIISHIDNDDDNYFDEADKGLEGCRLIEDDILVGNCFIAGDGVEELCSLTDEQIEKYAQRFAELLNIYQSKIKNC